MLKLKELALLLLTSKKVVIIEEVENENRKICEFDNDRKLFDDSFRSSESTQHLYEREVLWISTNIKRQVTIKVDKYHG